MNILHITTDQGVPMHVKLIRKGEAYGLKDCLTHDEDEPLVEFYDARQDRKKFDPEGQFISRYGLETLMGRDEFSNRPPSAGLCLQGDIPIWNVDPKAMTLVAAWLDLIAPPNKII